MNKKVQRIHDYMAEQRARGLDPWSDEGIAERYRKLHRSPLVKVDGRWYTVKGLHQAAVR